MSINVNAKKSIIILSNVSTFVKETQKLTGGEPINHIVDIASGPGEPALTLARGFPEANVFLTDGAEAMLTLAEDRIADAGVGDRVTTGVMDLNDFSPVTQRPVDLVTAQFALMFTPKDLNLAPIVSNVRFFSLNK